ncbi:MAG: HIT family protein [Phycisphaeraceae bacterium]|nr:HIT family protein [Phycisphaeraceae bacterium]
MNDPNCLFCKIVAGQIPCHRVYEDANVLAFLDIGPLARGHTLVIPKAHFVTLDQMTPQDVSVCTAVLPKLSRAVCRATGATAWNILQNNGSAAQQSIGHVHFHIIPRAGGDTIGYRWNAGKLDAADAQSLIEKITGSL